MQWERVCWDSLPFFFFPWKRWALAAGSKWLGIYANHVVIVSLFIFLFWVMLYWLLSNDVKLSHLIIVFFFFLGLTSLIYLQCTKSTSIFKVIAYKKAPFQTRVRWQKGEMAKEKKNETWVCLFSAIVPFPLWRLALAIFKNVSKIGYLLATKFVSGLSTDLRVKPLCMPFTGSYDSKV